MNWLGSMVAAMDDSENMQGCNTCELSLAPSGLLESPTLILSGDPRPKSASRTRNEICEAFDRPSGW